MASDGIISKVSRGDDLKNTIIRGIDSQCQKNVWKKIKKDFPDTRQSIKILWIKSRRIGICFASTTICASDLYKMDLNPIPGDDHGECYH